jgi:hypothetical protein
MTHINNFGLDLGFGNFKLVGTAANIVLPSHVAIQSGAEYKVAGLDNGNRPICITKDQTKYFAGAGAHGWGTAIENVDSNRLLGSPEASVLMYATFTKYMKKIKATKLENVAVAVGLPLELSKADEAKTNASKVKGWIRGDHTWIADGIEYSLSIQTVFVTSQAAGIIQDFALDMNGKPIGANKSVIGGEVGLISIGYRTIEIMMLEGMKMNQNLTAGKLGGVREFLELCNTDQLFTLGELDDKLRIGQVGTNEQQLVWERGAIGQIEKVWMKKWQRFEKVIIVGGGAEIASKTISNYFGAKLHKPKEPVLAIARGMFKWATAKSQTGTKSE